MPNDDPHHGVSPSERTELTASGRGRKKRRGRLLAAGLVVLIALGVLAVFAPKIAAPLVKGAIARTQPDGTVVELDTLALSWTGGQRAAGLRVTRPDGVRLADLDVSNDKGLLALLTGGYDLGTITVDGEVTLDVRPGPGTPAGDGAAAGEPKSGGRSVTINADLPESLRAALDLKRLGVTVLEPDATTLVELAGTGSLGVGDPIALDLRARATRDGSPVGEAKVALHADQTALTPDGFEASGLGADIEITRFASGVLDVLLGQDGRLAALLGETVDTLTLNASGTPDAMSATVRLEAPRLRADADLRYADGVLTTAGPATLSVESAGVLAWPEVRAPLADAGVAVPLPPLVTVTVTELRLPVPLDGFDVRTYDARAVRAAVEVAVGEAAFEVPAPMLGREGGTGRLGLAASTWTLEAADLAAGVRVAGDLETRIDQQPAGSVRVNATAADLLDASGALRLGAIPRLAGTAVARGVPTALLQPFAASSGLDLPADLGPTLELTLNADAPAPGSPSRLALTAKADRLSAVGALVVDGPSVRSDGVITATLADPAPALSRLLAGAGLTLNETGSVDVEIDELALDTDALSADPPDLSGAHAKVVVRAGPFDGSLAREGEGPLTFRVPRTRYDATIEKGAASLNAEWAQVRLADARAAGTTTLALRAKPIGPDARLTGTVGVTELDAEILGSIAGDERLAGALRALGPAFALTLRPDVTVGGAVGAEADLVGAGVDLSASGTLTPTGLDATARVHRVAAGVVDALAGRPGLGESALGASASGVVTVKAGRGADGSVGVPLDATVELTSPKARTAAPLRLRVTENAAELVGGGTLEWTLEPETLASLINTAEGPAPVALVATTPVRLDVKRAFVPLSAAETAPLAAEINLRSTAFTLRTPDGVEETFSGLTGSVRTTDTPGQVRARLDASGEGEDAESLKVDLVVAGVTPGAGELSMTGSVKAVRVPAGLIDAVAGTGGTAAQMLGARANARVDLDRFPADGSTLAASLASPNAQLDLRGAVRDGVISGTQPATVTLKRIEQSFGVTLAEFLPVVGAVTKSPKDQPATIEIPAFGVPLDGDPRKITLDLTADPGTGTLDFERGIVRFIDPRAVEKGRTLGDSFQPFRVTMQDGVVRVLDFVLPVGDFELPATATFDLNKSTEDIVVRLPAGALVGEALGDDLAPLKSILGSALNPPLRKTGALGADNKWKLDPSWKPPEQEKKDTGQQLIEGLGGLLRDRLEKERQKDEGESGG